MKVGRITSITVPDIIQSECSSYLKSHVSNITDEQIEYAVSKLGGRVSDLQALITKMQAGHNIKGIYLNNIVYFKLIICRSSR